MRVTMTVVVSIDVDYTDEIVDRISANVEEALAKIGDIKVDGELYSLDVEDVMVEDVDE